MLKIERFIICLIAIPIGLLGGFYELTIRAWKAGREAMSEKFD